MRSKAFLSRCVLLGCLLWGLAAPSLYASSAVTVVAEYLELELVSDQTSVQAGQSITVALRMDHASRWHTYWQNPGDTGYATSLAWQLPAGAEAGPIQWPYPGRYDFAGMIYFGYTDEAFLLTKITPPADLKAGEVFSFSAEAAWLICDDVCIPGEAEVSLSLPVTTTPTEKSSWSGPIEKARLKVPMELQAPDAEFDASGDNFVLRLGLSSEFTNEISSAQFFPLTNEIMSNAQQPVIYWEAGEVFIGAPKFEFYEAAPEIFAGVLLLQTREGEQAFEIQTHASGSPIVMDFSKGQVAVETAGLSAVLLAIAAALLGGLILNLMPCVLPVLSLKVLSIVQSSSQERSESRRQAQAYTVGILVSFLTLAGLLLALRASGEAIGWGFQLQSPWFVTALVFLLFIMGLSLSGVITLGSKLQNAGSTLVSGKGLKSSFFTGVLATLVATPCTAPFMGSAMGFAVAQPAWVALLVFAALGLGLALPFLLIAYIPALARLLPRPGAWMEVLKQALAFPLYGTAIWLLWVLNNQTGANTVLWVMTGLLLLVIAGWLWAMAAGSRRPLVPRTISLSLLTATLALLVWAIPVAGSSTGANRNVSSGIDYPHLPYSPTQLRDSLASGQTVLVNMTADWCITCKVNERVALATDEVLAAFKQHDVIYIKGDWTNRNAQIAHYLEQFQRSGVPLYVLYREGKEPQILPQILTAERVIQALNQ